jgi:hypothetical protein
MATKTIDVFVSGRGLGIFRISGRGRIRAISTSKIRKITAMRKNRKENGSRADLVGSNPHSKGDIFSRSNSDFFEIRENSAVRIAMSAMTAISFDRVIRV